MRLFRVLKCIFLGSVFATGGLSAAAAADLILYSPVPLEDQHTDFMLPAVSSINGKLEVSGGLFSQPGTTIGHARVAGSLSLPVTDRFGLQGDLAIFNTPTGAGGGAMVHAFTRDPSFYLLGVNGGAIRVPGAMLWAVGPEAELYLGQVSIEAWGGYANLNYDNVALADLSGGFLLADLAYYVTDDFRVSIGGRHVLGFNQLRLATEYQVTSFDVPFSVTGEGRFGQDGSIIATIGLKHYFGDPDRTLIERHREDDPPEKVVDFFGAAGSLPFKTAPGPTGPSCEDDDESPLPPCNPA